MALGPIQALNPNGFGRFAGHSTVTDRHTDHATRSVTISRISVHSNCDATYNDKK